MHRLLGVLERGYYCFLPVHLLLLRLISHCVSPPPGFTSVASTRAARSSTLHSQSEIPPARAGDTRSELWTRRKLYHMGERNHMGMVLNFFENAFVSRVKRLLGIWIVRF